MWPTYNLPGKYCCRKFLRVSTSGRTFLFWREAITDDAASFWNALDILLFVFGLAAVSDLVRHPTAGWNQMQGIPLQYQITFQQPAVIVKISFDVLDKMSGRHSVLCQTFRFLAGYFATWKCGNLCFLCWTFPPHWILPDKMSGSALTLCQTFQNRTKHVW